MLGTRRGPHSLMQEMRTATGTEREKPNKKLLIAMPATLHSMMGRRPILSVRDAAGLQMSAEYREGGAEGAY